MVSFGERADDLRDGTVLSIGIHLRVYSIRFGIGTLLRDGPNDAFEDKLDLVSSLGIICVSKDADDFNKSAIEIVAVSTEVEDDLVDRDLFADREALCEAFGEVIDAVDSIELDAEGFEVTCKVEFFEWE